MSARFLSRLIAVVFLGTVLAFLLHVDMEGHRKAGRGAFMAEESSRWERIYAQPHHFALGLFVCVSGTALAAGIYELVATGLYRLLKKQRSDETKTR